MAEQTFKSPGFFEQEIEITPERQAPQGVPAGIIGAAKMGPAFVPLTLGTFTDFENRFGSLTPEKFAPYAVQQWLNNRQSVTFCRVLGAGANSEGTHFQNTRKYGFVNNSGFKVLPKTPAGGTQVHMVGAAQFISAEHVVSGNSDLGFPLFTDNDTLKDTGNGLRETGGAATEDTGVKMVRAMILNTSGSYFLGKANNGSWGKTIKVSGTNNSTSNEFELKLVLDNYAEAADIDLTWGNYETTTAIASSGDAATAEVPNRHFTCSFDPDSQHYIGKVLNTDPKKFQEEGHLLWLDLAIEQELSAVEEGDKAIITTGLTTGASSDYETQQDVNTWNEAFGLFNDRYRAPRTTSFISQPYGNTEYDLFHFECQSDGSVANNEYKVSITNLRRSTDPNYKFGSFTVEIRRFGDSDFSPEIIERYTDCNLDPSSEKFVARMIGDKKAKFNFDAIDETERRLVVTGNYANRSLHVRIVMDPSVYKRTIPEDALPFGFRGIPVLDVKSRLEGEAGTVLPPMPYTYKASRGKIQEYDADVYAFSGQAGESERSDSRIYWGVKASRIEDDATLAKGLLQSNVSKRPSPIVRAYTKFMGIKGGSNDTGVMVADPDAFNNNKFTLARVAFAKSSATLSGLLSTYGGAAITDLGSPSNEMKNACYIRNGSWDVKTYEIADSYDSAFKRFTFASLVHAESAGNFNKFTKFMKFTNVFYGGWDGLNILDEDIEDLNDRASSTSVGDTVAQTGKSANDFTGGLGLKGTHDGSMSGKGLENNIIASYRQAIKIMTDDTAVKHNILAIPGIREPKITDFAASATRDYQMAMYIMDLPNYDEEGGRLFDVGGRPDVEITSDNFEGRTIDNNFAAAYFPDVYINDSVNNKAVMVPASVAAIGAIGYNDAKAYPWFAPAGFNRGALGFVSNVRTRLSVADRDELYEKRINPIANFPDGGFVIFGQKTMQIQPSALDRVNVRRMLLEVKRQVHAVANLILFEQHTAATRNRFVGLVNPRLALIQAQAGIEQFRVICDETNNSQKDIDENRMNGRILLVPTRAVEFIAIDFIVDAAGVSFV